MKLPEALFRIINPMMTMLLRSPLHGLMSASVLVLSFKGRRTGRQITFPLRYARTEGGVACFTTDDAKWWRNFEESRPVSVVVAGETLSGTATAQRVAPGESLDALRSFLTAFPSDAVYHGVTVAGGVPAEGDLQRASARSIRLQIACTCRTTA